MAVAFAKTFFESQSALTRDESARVTDFINKFMDDEGRPSISAERLQHAQADNLWSGRVSADLRVIYFKRGEDIVLVFTGHHDRAYAWAERRRADINPKTGVFQVWSVVEKIEEVRRVIRTDVVETPPSFREVPGRVLVGHRSSGRVDPDRSGRPKIGRCRRLRRQAAR